jgi:hypothetical protein
MYALCAVERRKEERKTGRLPGQARAVVAACPWMELERPHLDASASAQVILFSCTQQANKPLHGILPPLASPVFCSPSSADVTVEPAQYVGWP